MSVRVAVVSLALMTAGCAEEALEPVAPELDVEMEDTVEEGDAGEEAAVDPLVIDLGSAGVDSWYAVNDTVMGGVSEGVVAYSNNSLIFEGVVSTANNGGFASVRSLSDRMDLRDYERVSIRLKSEGQPFTLVLANTPNWWEGQFRYDLEANTEGWTDVSVDLRDLEFYDFNTGYPVPTGEMMKRRDKKDVLFIEFMSELFKDGSFRLEVDHITFE